jgi:hypothetical protein
MLFRYLPCALRVVHETVDMRNMRNISYGQAESLLLPLHQLRPRLDRDEVSAYRYARLTIVTGTERLSCSPTKLGEKLPREGLRTYWADTVDVARRSRAAGDTPRPRPAQEVALALSRRCAPERNVIKSVVWT